MKKNFLLFLFGALLVAGTVYAADDWDSYGNYDDQKVEQTAEDKKAVARNIAALARNPEALKAAANIAKIRMKQKEDAAAAAANGY